MNKFDKRKTRSPMEQYLKGRISVEDYVRKVMKDDDGDQERRSIVTEFKKKLLECK